MQLEWEIWLDNHISPIIAKWLNDEKGWIVKSAYILNLSALNDLEIYNKAKNYRKVIIITKDSDLPAIVQQYGSPPKIINLLIGNCHNRILYSILQQNLEKAVRLLIQFDKNIVEIV